MTIQRVLGSESDGGRLIPISATSGPGDLLHRAIEERLGFDEVWVWATNRHSGTAYTLTVSWGNTAASAVDTVAVSIAGGGSTPTLVIPGWTITGGREIAAYVNTGTDVSCYLHVNRILQEVI